MTKYIIPISLLIAFVTLCFFSVQSDAQTDNPPAEYTLYLPFALQNYDYQFHLSSPLPVILQPAPFSDPFMIFDSSGRPHNLWDTYSPYQTFVYHT